MSKGSILYDTILLTVVNLLLRLVSMVFQVYLSNLVGAVGIGLLQLTLTVGMFAITVGVSGIRVTAMNLTAQEFGHKRLHGVRHAMRCCFTYSLIVSSVVGAVLVLFADYMALTFVGDIRAAASIRVIGIFMPSTAIGSLLTGYFTAAGKIPSLVGIEILERLASIGLTVLALVFWAGTDLSRTCCAIIGGSSVAGFLSLIWFLFIYFKDVRRAGHQRAPVPMGRKVIGSAIPLALNDYLRSGLSTVEHLLIPAGLARSGCSTEAAMGAYGTIHGMVFPILMLPAAVVYALADLLVPELSRCVAQNNKERIAYLAEKCMKMGFLYAGAITGLMFFLSDALGILVYNSNDVGFYLRLFAPLVLILYADAVVDGMHKGLGQYVFNVRVNTITSVMDIILLWLLLPRFGISGYYFSFVVTHMFNFYLSISKLIKLTGYCPTWNYTWKVTLSTGVSILSASLLPVMYSWSWLIAAAVFFLSCFFTLCLVSDAITRADGRWLKKLISRTS